MEHQKIEVRKRPARKKTTAILLLALLLLIIKMAAGAYYILFDHTVKSKVDQNAHAQLIEIEENLRLNSGTGEAGSVTADKKNTVNDYIAVAAEAVSPAKAQAISTQAASAAIAHVPVSAVSTNAIAAGAFMVLGSQSSSDEAAKGGVSSIPLPPGSNDLLQPSTQLPVPDLPKMPEPAGSTTADQRFYDKDQNAAFRELRQRETALAQREASLNSRTEALNALEGELNKKLEAIDSARTEIDSMTKRNEAILAEQKALREQQQKEEQIQKDASIQHMVVALKSMKPDQAGALVNSLDDDVAVSIFSAMPARNVGLIMAFVAPEKAARLTKAISERRIDPNPVPDQAQAPPQ